MGKEYLNLGKEYLNYNTYKRIEINKAIDTTRKNIGKLNLDVIKERVKKALNRIKAFFVGDSKTDKKENTTGNTTQKNNPSKNHQNIENTPQQKLDYSRVDKSGFTPGEYPFAHLTFPYKGIRAYRVDNIRLKPLIGFSQLSLKGDNGLSTTLKVKDQPCKFNTKTAGYKKNNPCNVSPFSGDVGRTSSSKVADGQNHSQYITMEDGLASFMRLMRQPRYRNKSIQGINCSGMQGIYKKGEPKSLQALRITRITHACERLHVNPFTRLNTDNKETMMAFTQETAIRESGSYFDRDTLERAYKKAFPNEA